jgi:hypothetical protein
MARYINCGPGYQPEITPEAVERFLLAQGKQEMADAIRRQRQTIDRLVRDCDGLRQVANDLRARLHRHEPPRAEPAVKDYRGYGD